ncbi:MAG TPA: ATP-binding protein [Bacteroidales bacterium]|nr:ATP-binding protein [Bacteroidales bacterium]
MIYKKYYFRIVVRVVLIAMTSMLLSYTLIQIDKPYTIIVIFFLFAFQVYSLIRYNNRTNIELGKFFNALKDNDNTLNLLPESGSGSFMELTRALNETFSALKNARLEKEKQFQFLRFISDQVGIGLLVLDGEGNTVLYNNEVISTFDIDQPKSLSIIEKAVPDLPLFLHNLNPGESKIFKSVRLHKKILLVRSAEFTLGRENLRLFIFQDFKKEIEDTEIQTWHKMIRVLSHEIMNSVTPVINLAIASRNSLERIKNFETSKKESIEHLNDISLNTEIIGARMVALSDFVTRYKNASAIPVPEKDTIDINGLIRHVLYLLKDDIESLSIKVNIDIHQEGLAINGDKNMIEQVMINLVKNSIQAMERSEKKEINIECYIKSHKTVIVITDSGEGISKENMERVFLPFFTTRENGSGIGLSLSRQIIRIHGGTLDMWSEPGVGTKAEISL